MLDFSLSFITLVIIFLVTALVLVKLYRLGVKIWMVHTSIIVFTLFFIAFRPFELTVGLFEIYLAILLATIFTNDKHPEPKRNCTEKEEEFEDDSREERRPESLSETLVSFVLLYGLFDFFDEGDDW